MSASPVGEAAGAVMLVPKRRGVGFGGIIAERLLVLPGEFARSIGTGKGAAEGGEMLHGPG
jgi:hypothetical protein